MNIIDVIHSKKIFGALPMFKDLSTWRNWLVCLKAIFGLPMNDDELAIYKKFTGRENPPANQFKEAWLCIGRRGGKSFISALIAVFLAVFVKWKLGLELGFIMTIATDRTQASVVFNYIKRILQLPVFKGMVKNELKEEIELTNGIVISVKTCSYRALRGYQILAVVLDEVAFFRTEGVNPGAEICHSVRPSLGAIPGTLLLGISTGYSKVGIFWEMYSEKFGKDDEEVLFWKAGTRDMNPLYSQRVIDKAMKDDPSVASAEYLGEFRQDLETFLSTEAIEACVVPGRYELPRIADQVYYAAIDSSGGRGDDFVMTVFHSEGEGDSVRIVQDCIRVKHPPLNPQETIREFSEIIKLYGCHEVQGDRYAAEFCSSEFERCGLYYRNSELNKSEIYAEFLPLVMQGKVELLDFKQQIVEFRQLERRTRSGGKDLIDHPQGLHDDSSNCCALGAVICNEASRSVGPLVASIPWDISPD